MTGLLISLIALGVFVATSVVWFRLLSRVAIPDDRLGFLLLWGLAVLLGVAGLAAPGGGWIAATAGGLAALGGAVMLTLYAFGRQRAGRPIAVGEPIPAFSAADDQGRTFHSSSLAGSLALIKFFRGHW